MRTHVVTALAAVVFGASAPVASFAQGFSQSARITSIAFYDEGEIAEGAQSAPIIDTVQGSCGTDEDRTPEPFYETVVGIGVTNTSLHDLTVKSIRIRVPNADGARRPFRSRRLAPVGSNQVPSSKDADTTVLSLFTEASNGRKIFPGSGAIPSELGIRNLTVSVVLVDGRGRSYTLRGRVAVVFRDVDRCA